MLFFLTPSKLSFIITDPLCSEGVSVLLSVIILYKFPLVKLITNSMHELGKLVSREWVGGGGGVGSHMIKTYQEVFHSSPVIRNHPSKQPIPGTTTLKFSGTNNT